MALEALGGGNAAAASTAVRTAQLANDQQEIEGQSAVQLIESAAQPAQAASANPAIGSNINTTA
jgi:hypothetical protein